MPLHDVRCPNCGTIQRDVWIRGGALPTMSCCNVTGEYYFETTKREFFREGWYEHIDTNPIYIRTKQQLLAETRRRGVHSPFYEGGVKGAGGREH